MDINARKTNELAPAAFSMDIPRPSTIIDRFLISSAKAGNIANLRSAIEQGANIDVKDQRGYTALMILADIGNTKALEFMIGRGADIKAQSDVEGFTALMIAANSAASNGKGMAVVDALLRADGSKAHVNCAAHSGVTALMIALSAGNHKISLKLRDAGADINLLNENGLSALTYAATCQDADTLDFLLREEFPLSENQVWEAIGIAAKNNIVIFLTLWLEMEKNPEKFTASSQAPVIPEEVLRLKYPAAYVAGKGVSFNHQDRNANPAVALANPYVSPPTREYVDTTRQASRFYEAYDDNTRRRDYITFCFSDDESEDPPSPSMQRQSVIDNFADLNHPDNRLVHLSHSTPQDPPSGPTASKPNALLDDKQHPGSDRSA